LQSIGSMTSSITQITGFTHLSDLPCWQLRYGHATVVISNYGAHVLQYTTGNSVPQQNTDQTQQSQLWFSPKAVWQNKQPIRGGVPICWPWFGKVNPVLLAHLDPELTRSLKLPNHGLVRTRLWQKSAEAIDANGVSIEFCLEVTDIPWHPAPVSLRYLVRLDHQLTLTLSCDAAIAQQAALHSYFAVSASTAAQVQSLPTQYYDKVTDAQCHSHSDILHFQGEIDRVYPDTPGTLTLSDGTTRLQILQQGHDASVLWNPAAEKAAASNDIPADQWADFVCVEAARLTTEASPLELVQIIRPD
jgi:glucose-6-phosphate 1-epimerase